MKNVAARVAENGWAFLPSCRASDSILELASDLGSILDMPSLIPGVGIGAVQQLRPKTQLTGRESHYSGTFGLSGYPLHSDLAHWATPPRYIILRCLSGHSEVATPLLRNSWLVSQLGWSALQRALVRPRKSGTFGANSIIPLAFLGTEQLGLRWDSLFLTPANSFAEVVADMMSGSTALSAATRVVLCDFADTLVVDNWRVLHGRSAVPSHALNRCIERVYLSNLHHDT